MEGYCSIGQSPQRVVVPMEKKKKKKSIPTCLNYCEIFIICTKFTNVAASRIIQPGGPRVGDLDMELKSSF
jgi:hypothetical protein